MKDVHDSKTLPLIPEPKKRGRPPLGDKAMTNAEKQRRYRDKHNIKTWSYAAVTVSAEAIIKRAVALAVSAKSVEDAHIQRCFARGALQAWYELTCGWQEEGDYARLEALIES